MINFETELNKLLSLEAGNLPEYEFVELAAAGRELLAEFNKKQTDASLQIEEIYDLVKEQDLLQKTVLSEKTRADQLVPVAISLADLLEDFYVYAGQSGSEELKHQAKLQWENAGAILSSRGILRFGEEGQLLNPQYHTVKASVESHLPREQVVQVLQSGYVYQNTVIRKAAVVISRGQETEIKETMTDIEDQDIEDQDSEDQDSEDQDSEEMTTMDQYDDQDKIEGEQEDGQNSWY
jgi:molecular chaperone GrpE (heat shock protein)